MTVKFQTLRTRFSGCLSMRDQEKFHSAMTKIHEDRLRIRGELVQAIESTEKALERAEGMRVREAQLEELVATLKDKQGTQKLLEWHDKLEKLRLAELRLNRQLHRLQDDVRSIV